MKVSQPVGAKLGIRGAFECKDAAGNVLKVIEFTGAIPLEQLGMSVDDAKQLIEDNHGTDHRQ